MGTAFVAATGTPTRVTHPRSHAEGIVDFHPPARLLALRLLAGKCLYSHIYLKIKCLSFRPEVNSWPSCCTV